MKEIPANLRKLVEFVERPKYGVGVCGGSDFYKTAISEGLFREGDIVYDLGCGDGTHLPLLSEVVGEGMIYGIDIAPGLVSNAKKISSGLKNVEIYHMDASNLESPLNYESADRVLAFEVTQMIPKSLVHKILDEAIAASKPGGVIATNFESKDYFGMWLKNLELLRR